MTAPSPYFAIEGVIGVGKTTLAQLLQPVYEADLLLESFEQNPFLASFYADPERYAFQAQVVFLLSRFRQQREVERREGARPLISDYLFAKDQLFARLNLHGDEWETYRVLHAVLAERIVEPDLVLYLRAPVDILMERIRLRGRPYERRMEREYIRRLAEAYDEFFATYDRTRLLVVETESMNFPDSTADLQAICEQIDALLPLRHGIEDTNTRQPEGL